MDKSLALKQASLQAVSPQDREMALVEAFNRALVAASATQDVTVKAQIVQDARALSAMAAAYRVSEETQRKISEASIRLQRSFGGSLLATYRNASSAELQAKTGIPAVNCIRCKRLAKYSGAAVDAAFQQLRENRREVGIERTLRTLLENDAAYQVQQRLNAERVRKRNEEYFARRQADPDYVAMKQVWEEIGNWWSACREIVRLKREVVRLKSELEQAQKSKEQR